MGMQLVSSSFLFGREMDNSNRLQLDFREKKGHILSLPCIYTPS
jgi:hypothetical protein